MIPYRLATASNSTMRGGYTFHLILTDTRCHLITEMQEQTRTQSLNWIKTNINEYITT